LIVTGPLDVVTVTGNCAAAAAAELAAAELAVLADEELDELQPASAAAVATAIAAAASGTLFGTDRYMRRLPPGDAGRKARSPTAAERACRDGSPFPRGSISSSTAGGDLAWARTGRHSCGTAPEWSSRERDVTGFASCVLSGTLARPNRTESGPDVRIAADGAAGRP
jgi:hypothetical protein